MNRKDRRAQRSKERRGHRRGDTMGASYTLADVPEHVKNHPAYQRGLEAAKTGQFPPEYYELVERMAKLAFDWYRAEPTAPNLKWLEQKNDGVFVSGTLDVGARYLADSPDAFRLLAWLDEQTGGKATLNQAVWALRRCRALPMPDGSYYGVETVRESAAHKHLSAMVARLALHDEADRVAATPCGHCGKLLDGASSAGGHRPRPGDLTICIYCAGFNRLGDALELIAMSEAEVEALAVEHPDTVDALREGQSAIRTAVAKIAMGGRKGPVGEA